MSKLKPYPTWVCIECGANAAIEQHLPVMKVSTFHEGICGICGKTKAVTEPRDYGYPKFEGYEYANSS